MIAKMLDSCKIIYIKNYRNIEPITLLCKLHITSRFKRKIVGLTFDKFLGEGEIKLAESPTLIKDEFLPWLQLACCPAFSAA